MTIKAYYHLTKPGIIYGNALPTVAGFFLASRHHFHPLVLLIVLVGQSLIIASACVYNNYIDRDIDRHMARTSQRALVTGAISGRAALIYATVLGVIGTAVLALGTNWLTVAVGLVGVVIYVAMYGYTKRRGSYGTIVGSVAGAMPPVAGYTAVTGHLDGQALILFAVLVLWQMPHFYAIAMYRLGDYAKANIPVLPVQKGLAVTKRHILAYIGLFTVAAALLVFVGPLGYSYLFGVLILGGSWLGRGLRRRPSMPDSVWARGMFFHSLIVLTVWCVLVSASPWLP